LNLDVGANLMKIRIQIPESKNTWKVSEVRRNRLPKPGT